MSFAQEQQQINEQDVLNLANGPSVVSIECAGTCGCSLQGQLGGENDYVACSCAECMMNITMSVRSQNNDGNEYETKEYSLVNGKVTIPFIKEYFDFASPKDQLQSVDITKDEKGITAVYNYLNKAGVANTVIFTKANSATKKYQIECQGDCGCTVIYSFTTNSASCGCADCIMIVNEIASE